MQILSLRLGEEDTPFFIILVIDSFAAFSQRKWIPKSLFAQFSATLGLCVQEVVAHFM